MLLYQIFFSFLCFCFFLWSIVSKVGRNKTFRAAASERSISPCSCSASRGGPDCKPALSLFLFLEVFDSHSACRAHPAFREVFKRCSCRDTSFRISFCRIVDVSAENTYISVHNHVVFNRKANIQLLDRGRFLDSLHSLEMTKMLPLEQQRKLIKKRHPEKDAVLEICDYKLLVSLLGFSFLCHVEHDRCRNED